MDLKPQQLLEIAFDLAEAGHAELPEGLEARVLAHMPAGSRPRHPGWAHHDGALSSLSAFLQTAAELASLLDDLADAGWASTTRVDGVAVRGIVEHLVGVERYTLGQLGRRPRLDAPTREDHWPVTMGSADMANAPVEFVAKSWWSEALGVIAASAELGPDHHLAYHHLYGSLGGLLVVRTFELWTHGDDIRQATGRPFDLLDEDRLSLMVAELMRVLPLGLALSGCPRPGRTARLHLAGPGGGTFDVPLAPGESAGRPDITLSADTISLCRLAANRLAESDLDLLVEGDRSLLGPLLVGAAAFAAD
jgi:uncharacterized protein (TIGR03083 family)